MKMVFAIVQNQDEHVLIETLMENEFHVTKLATTGGFLKIGNTTLLIGVEEERLEKVLQIIREVCQPREQLIPNTTNITLGTDNIYSTYPIKVTVGGATIFVVDVERFEKI